jgi:uncharacterized Fe-S radical SAM superfamily protein PflX
MPDSAKLVWKTNAHGSAQSCELLDGIFDVWLADFKFGNDDCAQRLARVSDYVRIVEENLLRVAQGPASRSKDSPINTGLQPGDSESRATSAASAALSANGKPLKRLESLRSVCTGLKRGVNERERHASEVSDLLRGTQLTKSSDPLRRTELIVRHLLMPGHVDCCWRPVAHWLAAELAGVKVNLRSGFWPAWHSARHPELRGTVAHDESERALAMAHELGLNLIP